MLSSICGTGQGSPPHKLSKPPTNRSSSNLLAVTKQALEPASPVISSDADSADGYFTQMASTAERRPRRNTRSKIRSYLYGQNQDVSEPHSSEDEESIPKSFATVVKRRLSRTDSSTLLQASSLGASPASSTSRLFVVDTTGPDSDEHEVMKEQIKEKVWTDTLAAQNHISSPVDEDKHPDSVMTPIRRRSLYTPGIATRSPEDILRKPPPPPPAIVRSEAERDYYYNPARPESSPLSRLANLRASSTGRSTPSELNYTHLGAMKLGTLRVTNGGAASPIPRDQATSPVPTSSLGSASQEDFHTASEGDRGEEDPRTARPAQSLDMSPAPERYSLDIVTSPVELSTRPGTRPTYLELNTRERTPTPCHKSYGHPDLDRSDTASADCRTIRRKPLPAVVTTRQSDQLSLMAMHEAAHYPADPYLSLAALNRTKDEKLTPRPQEDTPSPELFAPPMTPSQSPDLWKAFIRAAEQRHADHGSREDAFLKLTGSHKSKQECGDVDGKPQNRPIEYPQVKDYHQIDSGYGSNTSLERTESVSEDPPPHDRPPSACLLEVPAQTEPVRKSCQENRGYDTAEASIATYPLNAKSEDNLTIEMACTRPSSRSVKDAPQPKSAQEHLLSSPEKSRKLQKKRPKSQPPMQRIPMSEHDGSTRYAIPPVPIAIAGLHAERTMRFPLLDHTHSSTQDANNHDPTMGSISTAAETRCPYGTESPSVNDKSSLFQKLAARARSRSRSRHGQKQALYQSDEESIKSDIMRSPSWSEYGNTKKKEQKKKDKAERELQRRLRRESGAEPKPDPKPRSRSRFRSRSRGRSIQQEPSQTLTDFGTVRESLGASPYDVARSSLGANHKTTSKSLQPHQISTAKCNAPVGKGPLENDHVHSRHRSQTMAKHAVGLNGDSTGQEIALSQPSRPYSMFVDRPPLPALPVTNCRASSQGYNHGMLTGPGLKSMSHFCQASPATSMLDLQSRDNAQQSHCSDAPDDRLCGPSHAPSATMEELIDKLLDAPDAETKESLLQQMRQLRRGLIVEPGGSYQSTSEIAGVASEAPEDLNQTTASKSQEPTPSVPKPQAIKPKAGALDRPQDMSSSAPPIPPIPSTEHIQQNESRKLVSKREQNRTLLPPRTQAPVILKADLWAGGAMATERKKANKPGADWDCHRLAWSQRRRSAGEALLSKGRPSGQVDGLHEADNGDPPEEPAPQSIVHGARITRPEHKSLNPHDSKAFHKPWAPPHAQQASQSHIGSLQPENKVAAQAQAFERLTGRFDGGLQYGYEPGFGLGGSAGTRSTKTGATRKSVLVSQGYGVDLSDVPIFVAPSK
ncbi:MAG: hypothetical protein L6R39_000481 [Caloplaca ligustica]|nr:MAG: hypothetical protein L6R39_000481 [Caloplaca ligustica]